MKNLITGAFLLIFIAGCNPPPIGDNAKNGSSNEAQVKNEKYLLSISEVDNSVKVYVEDSLIFSSGTIHGSPEVDYQIDFSEFISDESETLKIELYNGVEPFEPQVDPLWEIRFDLVINGEIVDFVHEFGDDNGIGKVYEINYVISEWSSNQNEN